MSWFTSRYTRSLEEQVAYLKGELARREQQLDRVQRAYCEAMDAPKPAIVPKKRAAGQDDQPKVGNWLRSRDMLERKTDPRFERHEPEPDPQRKRNEE